MPGLVSFRVLHSDQKNCVRSLRNLLATWHLICYSFSFYISAQKILLSLKCSSTQKSLEPLSRTAGSGGLTALLFLV